MKIFDAQNLIKSLLDADPFFAGTDVTPNVPRIPVVVRREGNLNQKLSEAIGTVGIVAVVMLADGDNDAPAGGIEFSLKYAVAIKEQPIINQSAQGTNKPAEDVVFKAIEILHWKAGDATIRLISKPYRFTIGKNAITLKNQGGPKDTPLNYTIVVNVHLKP